MLPGILLTAEEHELALQVNTTDAPNGDGWVLISTTTGYCGDGGWDAAYHWARRCDGKPLAQSSDSADAAWRRVNDLLSENVKLRDELATVKAQLELVRKGRGK